MFLHVGIASKQNDEKDYEVTKQNTTYTLVSGIMTVVTIVYLAPGEKNKTHTH